MHKDILSGLLEGITGLVKSGGSYAAEGVQIASSLFSGGLTTDVKKTIADVEETISDVKAGKYGEVVADAGSVINDVVKDLSDVGVKFPILGTLAAALPQLPSVGGLKAANAPA